jgi:hypothetical protein
MKLYCQGCDSARVPLDPLHVQQQELARDLARQEEHARNERVQQQLELTVQQQQQQIDGLQQQIRVLIPLVSCKMSLYAPYWYRLKKVLLILICFSSLKIESFQFVPHLQVYNFFKL